MALIKEIAKGASWAMLFRILSRSIGFISIFILARLLEPEDFGIMALAMAMIATLELASNFSFDIALIQKQDATPHHYDTVWTITLMFQSGIAMVLLASAYPIAGMFDEPNLGPALMALAIAPILEGLQNVRVVDFRKKMLFHKDFTFMLTKRVIGFAVTIPLAFYLRNYWALIIGTIAGYLSGTIISYILIPNIPKLGLKHWKELFNFSKWLFANNIMFFLRYRASDLIIGKIAGTQAVGLFEVSNQIGDLPTTELVAPINRAVLPGLSTINKDAQEFSRNYLRILGVIVLLVAPAGVGISAIAEPLVQVALGDKWLGAIPIITILGVTSAISSLETNTGTTCVALGRPDLVTKLYGFYVTVLLTLTVWFTSTSGAVGAAWAWLLTSLINAPVYYTVMLKTMRVSAGAFIRTLWRPVIGSTIMFVCVRAYIDSQPDVQGSFANLPVLLTSIGIGAGTYGLAISGLWLVAGAPAGAEQEVWVRLRDAFRSLRSA